MTRLEQLRLDAGLTPEELGALTKVSGMTIRRIEDGEKTTPKTLHKLSVHFKVPASDLRRPALPVVGRPDEKAAAAL